MKTLESVHEFIVPKEICELTDSELRAAGRTSNEYFVLWSGTAQGERFHIKTFHAPRQTAFQLETGLCVQVDADELDRLNRWLYEASERLAVQIHTHPTTAFHSDIDDTFPIVTTLGGLSLVVPDFCCHGVRGPGTALYRLASDGWQELSQIDARHILQMEA